MMPISSPTSKTYQPYDYETAIRERFDPIDQLGVDATNTAKAAAARRLAAQQADQQNQLNAAANFGRQQNANNLAGAANPKSFQGFLNAIASQESGGNYNARNKDSGAMGKYQIMPSNLGGSKSGWDYEALGYDVSPAQFMASPQIQEKVATYKLQQYYNAYGPAGAAIAWYAGPAAAQKYAKTGVGNTSSQGAYPTIDAYMYSILKKMGLA